MTSPKRPSPESGWRIEDRLGCLTCTKGPVYVLSSVDPSGAASGLEYHVSISGCSGVKDVLRDFGMTEASEDKKNASIARHFYLPVDNKTKSSEATP